MPDNLKEVVIGFLAGSREILGSRLGFFIKRTYPQWDFKTEFGTLRALVDAQLADLLEHVGKQGGNDIYRNRLFQDEANTPSKDERELSGADRDLWALFSNPTRTGSIFVRANKLFTRHAITSIATGELELPRISNDEYTELLPKAWRLCTEEIPDDIRSHIDVMIAENPSQWSAVLNFLRKTGHFAVTRRLEELRINYIIEQFRLRLQNLGLPAETVQAFVEQLAESRGRKAATKQVASNHPSPVLHAASQDQHTALLRQIAKAAIDGMTVEQLISLNLPLGLVANSLLATR